MRKYYKIKETADGFNVINTYVEYFEGCYYLIAMPLNVNFETGMQTTNYGSGIKKSLFKWEKSTKKYDEVAVRVAEEQVENMVYYLCKTLGTEVLDWNEEG